MSRSLRLMDKSLVVKRECKAVAEVKARNEKETKITPRVLYENSSWQSLNKMDSS